MRSELVAEQMVKLPVGEVRLTLARHDDGHYSGVAALVDTGQRIGMLEAGPVLDGIVHLDRTLVDVRVAGPEVLRELRHLLAATATAETGVDILMEPTVDGLSGSL